MKRRFLLAVFVCLVALTAACQWLRTSRGVRPRDISEIEMVMQSGLPGAAADFVVRRDGAAALKCSFHRTGEVDLRENSMQVRIIEMCGKLYLGSRDRFVKEPNSGSDALKGVSKSSASPEQFSRLAELIVRNDYFARKDEYSVPGLMDAPPTLTRVVYSVGEKRISNQASKGGLELEEIQKAIYTLANEIEWP